MLNRRSLILLIAIGLLVIGLGSSRTQPTFNERWKDIMHDIAESQRQRTVAEDK